VRQDVLWLRGRNIGLLSKKRIIAITVGVQNFEPPTDCIFEPFTVLDMNAADVIGLIFILFPINLKRKFTVCVVGVQNFEPLWIVLLNPYGLYF
jgi:hypothetical protein